MRSELSTTSALWLLAVLSLLVARSECSEEARRQLKHVLSLREDSEEVVAMKQALPRTLYHCQTDPLLLPSVLYKDGEKEQSETNCTVARFLWDHWRETDAVLVPLSESESNKKTRTIKIDTLSADEPYTEIFEKYMVKSRAFKKSWSRESSSPVDWLSLSEETPHTPWLRSVSLSSLSHTEQSESETDPHSTHNALTQDDVSLPGIAANSYVRRLSVSLRERLHSLLPESCASTPCVVPLPTQHVTQHVTQRAHTTPAHACPLNAQALLWLAPRSHNALSQPAESALSVELVEKTRTNHFALRPSVEVNITRNDVLSHQVYGLSVERETETERELNGNRGHTTLSHNEWLFVPHNYLFSLSLSPSLSHTHTERETERETALLLCVTDASSVQSLARALSPHTTLSLIHTQLRSAISAKSFDFSMEKSPAESLSLSLFLAAKDAATTSAENTEGVTKREGEKDTTAQNSKKSRKNSKKAEPEKSTSEKVNIPASRKNRKNRQKTRKSGGKSGGKSDFQAWQESVRWKALVDSLSLGAPLSLSVSLGERERERVEVRWTPARTPAPSDQSAFGVTVEVCALPPRERESERERHAVRERDAHTERDSERERETEKERDRARERESDVEEDEGVGEEVLSARLRERVVWPAAALLDDRLAATALDRENGEYVHFLPLDVFLATPTVTNTSSAELATTSGVGALSVSSTSSEASPHNAVTQRCREELFLRTHKRLKETFVSRPSYVFFNDDIVDDEGEGLL